MFCIPSTNITTIKNALRLEYLTFPFKRAFFYNEVYILPIILFAFIVIQLNTLKTSVIFIQIMIKTKDM